MKSVRILALAALFIALRIALASFYIPVGDNLKNLFHLFRKRPGGHDLVRAGGGPFVGVYQR
jgi:hypothetical protein